MRTFSFLNKAHPDQEVPPPFVFLGGTVNSSWREKLIPMLTVGYFNPIVPDWTPECQQEESEAKEVASASLYVITPKQTGFYAIAELTHAAFNSMGHKVIVCFLDDDEGAFFTKHQKDSNAAIETLVNAGQECVILHSLEEIAIWLNREPKLKH